MYFLKHLLISIFFIKYSNICVVGEKMKIEKINNINANYNYEAKNNAAKKSQETIDCEKSKISNVCYKPLSFGRSWAEHKSWGAVVDPKTKDVSFKIFTYPDTKKVAVTIKKNNNEEHEIELENKGKGIFETRNIPKEIASHGDSYYYTLYKGNGEISKVKDPYSFQQDKLMGESVIYDHSLYQWEDADWYKHNPDRISRIANKGNNLTPLNAAKIYEFNTASFTQEGSFESAKEKIKELPNLGFNAIELLPAENTFSFNWGYDGVDKFAPSGHLGGPDKLKELIDYAHSIGLNVIMDMVPNHLGPDGASLKTTGPYIKGGNQFGEAFNYEGKDSKYVRDYMVNAALNWINNYHCDGLRLDMTKFMESDITMKQIAAEVNYHNPDAFLIAEDSREKINVRGDDFWTDHWEPHDKRVVNPLLPHESAIGQNEYLHETAIERIENNQTSLARLGYDSEWDFNYFHNLKSMLYGAVDLGTFEKAYICAQDRVVYVESHDEIGNFDGTRLIAKLMVPELKLNNCVQLDSEDVDRAREYSKHKNCSYESALNTVSSQKAQLLSEKLAILLQTGEIDKYQTNAEFTKNILEPLGLKDSGITAKKVRDAFQKAFSINKMAIGITYSIPAPKMIFQGDENADLTPFRFFRQFDSIPNEPYLYIEKGYKPGLSALNESKLGNIDYSKKAQRQMNEYQNLVKDLNIISKTNKAITNGDIIAEETIKHPISQVFAAHAKDYESNNEIYTIVNFSELNYPRKDAGEYFIKFPKGTWVEVINTDNVRYGGSGNTNQNIIISDGHNNTPIKLSAKSTLMFKRIG